MGEEIPHEEFPDAEAPSMSDYFAPVTLSPHAIDRASQIVPEEYWQAVGLYTWLQGRADGVFKKLPTSKKEYRLGKLTYVFEYTAEGPVLKTVQLNP